MKSLDHLGFRIHHNNHKKTCDMFVNLFGYEIVDEFEPEFPDGTTQSTICTVLSPKGLNASKAPRIIEQNGITYQTMPDIFISSSIDSNSIVSKYVKKHNDIGALQHIAFSTNSVTDTMKKFNEANIEFLTKEPLICEELTQTFTKTSDLTNIIFEFIERRQASFCKKSVAKLMESTKGE